MLKRDLSSELFAREPQPPPVPAIALRPPTPPPPEKISPTVRRYTRLTGQ